MTKKTKLAIIRNLKENRITIFFLALAVCIYIDILALNLYDGMDKPYTGDTTEVQ